MTGDSYHVIFVVGVVERRRRWGSSSATRTTSTHTAISSDTLQVHTLFLSTMGPSLTLYIALCNVYTIYIFQFLWITFQKFIRL